MVLKERLLGKTLEQLKVVAADNSLPSFTAKQMADWIYHKRVGSIDQMTNISKAAREKLSQKYEVGRLPYSAKIASKDGTKKYLFMLEEGGIEAVMIPDDDRRTICVSSQVGCKMGCKFCMTGRGGFHGNLSAADIISQFMEIDEATELTNAVFMGMGEPLDNFDNVLTAIEILTSEWGFGWSPKRITLSTIGVLPKLKEFLDKTSCHLAVSLHNPFPEQRAALMPVQKAWSIEDVVALIKQYDFTGQRRVSFEYIIFNGVNDSKRHADELLKLLRGLECRVNMIRFHKIPDSDLETSPMPVIEQFQKRMNGGGVVTTLRASRGEDILAACGMLAGKIKENN